MRESRPAFVVGVTGKMTFPGYGNAMVDPAGLLPAARALRGCVFAVLDWTRCVPSVPGPAGGLDPATGIFHRGAGVAAELGRSGPPATGGGSQGAGADVGGAPPSTCWPPLGLANTPIVLVSSLAPGVDTLVAEAALDYAAERQADVSVRAALPFPLPQYRRSSSFRPAGREATWDAKLARFDALVERIRGQSGFVEERDLFCVALHPHIDGDPEADLEADQDGVPRRRLRYRAAGEYVAARSHLLLAVCPADDLEPEGADGLAVAGTGAIVEVKRRGGSYELLSPANSFAWTESGPVLHIRIDPVGAEPARRPGPLSMLHAYDLRPEPTLSASPLRRALEATRVCGEREPGRAAREAGVRANVTAWERAGDAALRRTLARLEEFNALDARPREAEELAAVVGDDLTEGARAFAGGLDHIARVRRRAASRAVALDARRERLMIQLAALILGAATFLRSYEHWNPQRSAADTGSHDASWVALDGVGLTRTALLLASLLCVLGIGRLFWRYRRSGAERERFDLRALGEALRVQLAWCLCGVPASVATDSMQRQRGELGWVRHAVASLALPAARWSRGFRALDTRDRVALLRAAREFWVRGQSDWFRRSAAKFGARQEWFHHWGWTLLAAGLLNVVGKFLGAASPPVHHLIEQHPYRIAGVGVAVGMLLLTLHAVGQGLRAARAPDARHEHDGAHHAPVHAAFWHWLFHRPALWAWALVVGAATFALPHALAGVTTAWPGAHEWWLIATGVPIVAGGLALAWSERSFHGENVRRYRAMATLFEGADRRLAVLIDRYEATPAWDPDETSDQTSDDHLLREIHDILRHLGREALDESAEWLVLRRTRPLEPFLAG